jgi:hypothetical protein
MTSHETSGGIPEENSSPIRYMELQVPEKIDGDWCSMFIHLVSTNRVGVSIHTDEVYRERLVPGCKPPLNPEFRSDDFDPNNLVLIEGAVIGIKLIPEMNSDGEIELVIPNLLLNEVEISRKDCVEYGQENQRFMTPLVAEDGILKLYFIDE